MSTTRSCSSRSKVVSQDEYDAYIESLRDAGHEGRLGAEYNTNSNLPGTDRQDDERGPGE